MGEEALGISAVFDGHVAYRHDSAVSAEAAKGGSDLFGALVAQAHQLIFDHHDGVIRAQVCQAFDDVDALVGEVHDLLDLPDQASQEFDGAVVFTVPELIAEVHDLLHGAGADFVVALDVLRIGGLGHDRLVVSDLGPGLVGTFVQIDVTFEEVHDHPAGDLELVVEHGLMGDLGQTVRTLRGCKQEDEAELGAEGDVRDVGAHEGQRTAFHLFSSSGVGGWCLIRPENLAHAYESVN